MSNLLMSYPINPLFSDPESLHGSWIISARERSEDPDVHRRHLGLAPV